MIVWLSCLPFTTGFQVKKFYLKNYRYFPLIDMGFCKYNSNFRVFQILPYYVLNNFDGFFYSIQIRIFNLYWNFRTQHIPWSIHSCIYIFISIALNWQWWLPLYIYNEISPNSFNIRSNNYFLFPSYLESVQWMKIYFYCKVFYSVLAILYDIEFSLFAKV